MDEAEQDRREDETMKRFATDLAAWKRIESALDANNRVMDAGLGLAYMRQAGIDVLPEVETAVMDR